MNPKVDAYVGASKRWPEEIAELRPILLTGAMANMSAPHRDDRPMANTYWVDPGRFAAGEYPGATNRREAAVRLRTLLRAGINHFIDLTRRADGLAPYVRIAQAQARAEGTEVRWEHHPIVDMSVPRSAGEMTAILDAIDDALNHRRTVYVHCWGGIGRTGTVVGCWLVRHGLTGDGALEQIAEWWKHVEKSRWHPHSPQTREQRDYVRGWGEQPDRRRT